MADVHYYVSQQRGDDTNDGLSYAAPWKTLDKANVSVLAQAGGDTYIHIGPGTYRERLVLANGGTDRDHRIIWISDPDAIRVRGDRPGRVRITGADENETPTAGDIVSAGGMEYVEFWDLLVDGSSNGYAFSLGVVKSQSVACVRCIGVGYSGFKGGSCRECAAHTYTYGFNEVYASQCVAICCSSGYGFSNSDAILCLSLAGYGFSNSVARGCLAMGCDYVFYYSEGDSCLALGFNNISSGGSSIRLLSVKSPLFDSSMPGAGYPGMRSQLLPWMIKGLSHNSNISTGGTSVTLDQERFYYFAPDEAGISLGLRVFIYTTGTLSGSLVMELQKKVGSEWQTQKTSSVLWSRTSAFAWNGPFFWDSGSGDDYLTVEADKWRFRFTSTTNNGSLRTSDNVQVTCYGLFYPDSLTNEDFNGLPRHQGDYLFMPGPFQPQIEELDYDVYHDYAPSVRLGRRSSSRFTISANRDVPISLTVWVKHKDTLGLKPRIRIRGLDIAERAAVCSAEDDTWEELTLEVMPTVSGVLEVFFDARDPAENAVSWFEFAGVS